MKENFREKCVKKIVSAGMLCAVAIFGFSCVPPQTGSSNTNVNAPVNTNTNTAPVAPAENEQADMSMPVTLPVLDAMFADEEFTNSLKTEVNLTDDEITKIKKAASDAVDKLRNSSDEDSDSRSTRAAMERAGTEIRGILGDEKSAKLFDVVRKRWSGDSDTTGNSNGLNNSGDVNKIPDDTRIVVNAPAYRMDLFQDGKLTKSYKIGIGYPEFPLPSGMRQAKTIIFNPTWTPPDEPWVKGGVEAGKTIGAGSKQNPLGPIKIPIGLPSLIHGGKNPAKLGTFASHGCVGLTSPQIQDFALNLAKISGLELTEKDITNYEKEKTETKNVSLDKSIPVELRYETIVVVDGKLFIYRDVYERGTNTEENLRRVLQNYGVNFDDLDQKQQNDILSGLKQMSYTADGKSTSGDQSNSNSNSSNSNANKNLDSKDDQGKSKEANSKKDDVEITRTIKGKKEVSFEIEQLKGKGYPAPVDLSEK